MKAVLVACFAFAAPVTSHVHAPGRPRAVLDTGVRRSTLRMVAETEAENDVEKVTKKWGLEAGLFKALTADDDKAGNGDKGSSRVATAKDLLAQYGSAYLLTSIPLALMSFAICYVLVDNGVDVGELLAKIGIQVSGTTEKAGTAAIAYAAHKAASPIRFPPTVALTPVVAQLIGKKKAEPSSETDAMSD